MSDIDENDNYVIVPPERLTPEILDALIEDFILREGANHGAEETAMDTKVAQVKKQLANASALIVFHLEEETTRIIPAHMMRRRGA